jgi:hypothetical protein
MGDKTWPDYMFPAWQTKLVGRQECMTLLTRYDANMQKMLHADTGFVHGAIVNVDGWYILPTIMYYNYGIQTFRLNSFSHAKNKLDFIHWQIKSRDYSICTQSVE